MSHWSLAVEAEAEATLRKTLGVDWFQRDGLAPGNRDGFLYRCTWCWKDLASNCMVIEHLNSHGHRRKRLNNTGSEVPMCIHPPPPANPPPSAPPPPANPPPRSPAHAQGGAVTQDVECQLNLCRVDLEKARDLVNQRQAHKFPWVQAVLTESSEVIDHLKHSLPKDYRKNMLQEIDAIEREMQVAKSQVDGAQKYSSSPATSLVHRATTLSTCRSIAPDAVVRIHGLNDARLQFLNGAKAIVLQEIQHSKQWLVRAEGVSEASFALSACNLTADSSPKTCLSSEQDGCNSSVRAFCSFDGQEYGSDYLTCRHGDLLHMLSHPDEDEDWSFARCEASEGWVPSYMFRNATGESRW